MALRNPIRNKLRTFTLAMPGAHEEFPWGESVVKVDGKIFIFLGDSESEPTCSLKLPASNAAALAVAGATPTRYGLGRALWVTIPLQRTLPPIDILKEWVEESYRAIARKSRIAQLGL